MFKISNNSGYFFYEPDLDARKINNPIHYHKYYEIYLLQNGICRYFIDKKSYILSEGDIVVIPPGIIHNTVYETEKHSRILINCSEEFIPKSVAKNIKKITYFGQSPETKGVIDSIYKKIHSTITLDDEFTEESLKSLVYGLLITIARSEVSISEVKTGSPFIERAVGFIRKNYSGKLTLTQTAQHLSVSVEHLSRVFKRETGFGFNEYVNIYRLKKAESLIKNGNIKSISEVAYLCGFNDSNYFSNAFKKMYNITPSELKKQNEKENQYV